METIVSIVSSILILLLLLIYNWRLAQLERQIEQTKDYVNKALDATKEGLDVITKYSKIRSAEITELEGLISRLSDKITMYFTSQNEVNEQVENILGVLKEKVLLLERRSSDFKVNSDESIMTMNPLRTLINTEPDITIKSKENDNHENN